MGNITLLNKHHFAKGAGPKDAIYIGRGSPLGNPYPVETYGREPAIEMYKSWLDEQIKTANEAVISELDRIGNIVIDDGEAKLLCFCAPKHCHGEVIKKVVLDQIELVRAETLIYAGIGSPETPIEIQQIMCSIAEQLAPRWVLRSGYADGADKAFFAGANQAKGESENYLPWENFNDAPSNDPHFIVPIFKEQLLSLAMKYHPAWNKLKDGAKKLHARNGCQILGSDLVTPAKMVICWTKDGLRSGGTGQALRIAEDHHIPIFDLALPETGERLCRFVNAMEAS